MYRNLDPRALGIVGSRSEIIELALSYGFKGISIDLVEFADEVRTYGMPHARRLLDSAKLRAATFRLPIDWTGDDAAFSEELGRLAPLAECAAELGCTRALTSVAPGSDLRPYHQNFEFHRQRLTALAGALAPHGIRLAVGFDAAVDRRAGFSFEFIHNLDALVMLIGMISAENVGLLLDLWNVTASGGSLDPVRKLGANRIVAVETADAPEGVAAGLWKTADRALPGETGTVDLQAALVTLAEIGYAGPITPSPDQSRLAGMTRDAIAKAAGTALESAWKAAGLTPGGKLAQVAVSR